MSLYGLFKKKKNSRLNFFKAGLLKQTSRDAGNGRAQRAYSTIEIKETRHNFLANAKKKKDRAEKTKTSPSHSSCRGQTDKEAFAKRAWGAVSSTSDCLLCCCSQFMPPSNYGRAGRPSGWMADEVMICQPLSAVSTSGTAPSNNNSRAAGKGGAAGHDRCKKDKGGNRNRRPNGNLLTGIVGFFTGFDKSKNKSNNPDCNDSSDQQRARTDTDRADTMSTPLTAHDSGGEESELRDQDPAPLPQSGWGIHPPVAGGQTKRRTSQPVVIKQTSGTRPKRGGAQETRRAPTGARGGGNQPRREEGTEAGGSAEEDKIKAWQQRRMAAKRDSFTVRRAGCRGKKDTHTAAGDSAKQPLFFSGRVMLIPYVCLPFIPQG